MSERWSEQRFSSSSTTSNSPSDPSHDQAVTYTTTYTRYLTPPAPEPSPLHRSSKQIYSNSRNATENPHMGDVRHAFQQLDTNSQNTILAELLSSCTIETLVHLSNVIAPRIKRDFLKDLPTEISLHILSFIDDPKTLVRASAVSKHWNSLLMDECIWKNMCGGHKFCCPQRLKSPSDVGECNSPRARIVRRLSLPDVNYETNLVGEDDGCGGSISMDEDDEFRYGHHTTPESSHAALAEFKMQLDRKDSGMSLVLPDTPGDSDSSEPAPPQPSECIEKCADSKHAQIECAPAMGVPFDSCTASIEVQDEAAPPPASNTKGKEKHGSLRRTSAPSRQRRAQPPFLYRQHFKVSYLTGMDQWSCTCLART
ncbi:uncharacterized protein EI90DRAFT_1393654 [Cantharellus anzutake]|uniref:uncharacterized protein n=1 Tax=Cantharellus anzutake TaxID=1750568 RepID=UPI001903BEE3|nr:uncharacterized protein EI90DRAFT_1393654 [Cantharellus anzutake]KAF8329428.1 hypothetical protein EI90DRAFT_1393654 [Cantharellus anzutake]